NPGIVAGHRAVRIGARGQLHWPRFGEAFDERKDVDEVADVLDARHEDRVARPALDEIRQTDAGELPPGKTGDAQRWEAVRRSDRKLRPRLRPVGRLLATARRRAGSRAPCGDRAGRPGARRRGRRSARAPGARRDEAEPRRGHLAGWAA